MGLDTAIKTMFTLEATGVSAMIGDRAYLGELTQDPTFPCEVHVPISDAQDRVHPGESDNRGGNGLFVARWQIDAYGNVYATASQLAKEIDRFLSPLKRHSVSDVIITSCRRLTQRSVRESAIQAWRFITDYEFMYSLLTE